MAELKGIQPGHAFKMPVASHADQQRQHDQHQGNGDMPGQAQRKLASRKRGRLLRFVHEVGCDEGQISPEDGCWWFTVLRVTRIVQGSASCAMPGVRFSLSGMGRLLQSGRNIQTHQKSGSGCRGLVDLFCGMDDCGVMRGSGRSQNLGVLSNDGLIPLFAASLMLI